MGLPTNSPSMDGTGSLSGSVPQANTSTVQAGTTTVLSANKNCFQADTPSPSNQNRSRNTGSSSVLTHNLSSNPSTPLSHLSPKEFESFGQSSAGMLYLFNFFKDKSNMNCVNNKLYIT